MKFGILWNFDLPKYKAWPQEIPEIFLPMEFLYAWISKEIMVILWLIPDEQNATGPQLCNRVPYDVEAFYSACLVCLLSVG